MTRAITLAATLALSVLLGAAPEPFHGPGGDIEPASAAFFDLLDLTRPDMAAVATRVTAGKYTEALDAWRDATVERLRSQDWISLVWSGAPLTERHFAIADLLIERISTEESLQIWKNEPPFIDLYGLRGAPGKGKRADFTVALPSDPWSWRYSIDGLFPLVYLFERWRGDKGDAYRQKYFEVAADFCQHQFFTMQRLKKENENDLPGFYKRYPITWSKDFAGSALGQAIRTEVLTRTLAAFCKYLGKERTAAAFAANNRPFLGKVTGAVPAAEMALIPPRETAIIALSLIYDHPQALLDRCLSAGAIPNQRWSGLEAVARIARAFPEFKRSSELCRLVDPGIVDYAKSCFNADGGQLEQSFNYNWGLAYGLAELPKTLDGLGLTGIQVLADRANDFFRVTTGIRLPTGGMPQKGTYTTSFVSADDMGPVGRSNSELSLRKDYDKYFAAPWPPTFTSITFPFSGYTTLRKDWTLRSPWLFLSSSREARGHQGADMAGVQLHAYGRWLLISAGAPYYDISMCTPEEREHYHELNTFFEEQSSRRYNTLLIDDLMQVRSNFFTRLTPYPEPTGERFHAGRAFDLAQATHVQGWGVPKSPMVSKPTVNGIHRRLAIFLRDQATWLIIDQVSNLSEGEHQVAQSWIFPPRLYEGSNVVTSGFALDEVHTSAGEISTHDPASANIYLHPFGSHPLSILRKQGAKDPHFGWFSRHIRIKKEPTVQALVTSTVSGSTTMVTLIGASPANESPFTRVEKVHSGEGLVAGRARLKSGAAVEFCVAENGAPFEIKGLSGQAVAWCTLSLSNETVQGLVVEGKGLRWQNKTLQDHDDFEFEIVMGKPLSTTRMKVPSTFSWGNDPAVPRPVYQ